MEHGGQPFKVVDLVTAFGVRVDATFHSIFVLPHPDTKELAFLPTEFVHVETFAAVYGSFWALPVEVVTVALLTCVRVGEAAFILIVIIWIPTMSDGPSVPSICLGSCTRRTSAVAPTTGGGAHMALLVGGNGVIVEERHTWR